MSAQERGIRSIWYLSGMMLAAMGLLVLAGGIADLLSPPAHPTVLAHLRPNLWWGAVMVAAGGTFLLTHRRS
jgi:hypothetical protein